HIHRWIEVALLAAGVRQQLALQERDQTGAIARALFERRHLGGEMLAQLAVMRADGGCYGGVGDLLTHLSAPHMSLGTRAAPPGRSHRLVAPRGATEQE